MLYISNNDAVPEDAFSTGFNVSHRIAFPITLGR